MRRYYITDRHAAGGVPGLLRAVERAVRDGVQMIQVRERDLPPRALLELVQAVLRVTVDSATQVLVNDRLDVALAAGAQGVHLRSSSVAVESVRGVVAPGFLIGVSCHTAADLAQASAADFVVLSPVFTKLGYAPALGLECFGAMARQARPPVYALGGVTQENAAACLAAGAAGIAGISLFQDGFGA